MGKGPGIPFVLRNTGNIEWYTPSPIVEAARATMGGIDLDPASCETANRLYVRASRYFTQEHSGLSQPWFGRVFMNPPYGRGLLTPFIKKLTDEFETGRVDQAVVLVNNATETRWGQSLLSLSSCACFIRGRIRFHRPDGTSGSPLQGQVAFYIGSEGSSFAHHFGEIGSIVHAANHKKMEASNG